MDRSAKTLSTDGPFSTRMVGRGRKIGAAVPFTCRSTCTTSAALAPSRLPAWLAAAESGPALTAKEDGAIAYSCLQSVPRHRQALGLFNSLSYPSLQLFSPEQGCGNHPAITKDASDGGMALPPNLAHTAAQLQADEAVGADLSHGISASTHRFIGGRKV